jgi:hypothetical protein
MRTSIPFLLLVAICVVPAHATVTVITNPQQWQSAVSSYSTLTFTDLPHQTVVTTQYSHLGITFTDGNDLTHISPSFPSDGHGLHSSDDPQLGSIHMALGPPRFWLAFDFIGTFRVDLGNQGQVFFTSAQYSAGFTPFVGFISTEPFDAAIARDWFDPTVAVDNIHFGPAIPAPGALVTLSLGVIAFAGRRRR